MSEKNYIQLEAFPETPKDGKSEEKELKESITSISQTLETPELKSLPHINIMLAKYFLPAEKELTEELKGEPFTPKDVATRAIEKWIENIDNHLNENILKKRELENNMIKEYEKYLDLKGKLTPEQLASILPRGSNNISAEESPHEIESWSAKLEREQEERKENTILKKPASNDR